MRKSSVARGCDFFGAGSYRGMASSSLRQSPFSPLARRAPRPAACFYARFRAESLFRLRANVLPGGVMVAQKVLDLLVQVRVLAG